MVSQTPAASPRLSLFLRAAHEWMRENYIPDMVLQALDAREQASDEVKRALDAAIRNSGVRVPEGGFRPQNAYLAPSHHLQAPVLRKMAESDELVWGILRVWMGSKPELCEAVTQQLQENEEPIYGPDRKAGCFRGLWSVRDWEANWGQFLAEHDAFDRDDVGLMLWCVSGKMPLLSSDAENLLDKVDFARWRELLEGLPPDAPQWEQAREFAAAVSEIVDSKERQRAQVAVNILKAKVVSIRERYSEELSYLERDLDLWTAGTVAALPSSVAALALEPFSQMEFLLAEYRPIRDQAESRSEEQRRASRRAELEAEIIVAAGEMERLLAGSLSPEEGGIREADSGEAAPAEAVRGNAEPEVGSVPAVSAPSAATASPPAAREPAPKAERSGNSQETVQETAASPEENAALRLEVQALRDENENLKAELHSCKDNEEYWRNAYVAAAKGPEAVYAVPQPQDVNGAVALAEEWFSDELLFRLNSKSWINKNNPYEDPQAVLDALKWLATTYYRSRTGEISVPKLDDSIYEVCRWKYVSNQSDVTMGQYPSDYRTQVDGKTYRLEEHIGRGSSKDPANTIRVAFHWDKERRRVIIGYIGQHQQTDVT